MTALSASVLGSDLIQAAAEVLQNPRRCVVLTRKDGVFKVFTAEETRDEDEQELP